LKKPFTIQPRAYLEKSFKVSRWSTDRTPGLLRARMSPEKEETPGIGTSIAGGWENAQEAFQL
jgi:hypothetical protein